MAMSLEDLLAEEGFKTRNSKRISGVSSGPHTSKLPSHLFRDEHKFGALGRLKKTERAYSDNRRYEKRVESPTTDKLRGRRSVDVYRREKLDLGLRNETRERHVNRYSNESSQQFSPDEIVEVKERIRKVKDRMIDKGKYKDIYLNDVFSPPKSKDQRYNRIEDEERYEYVLRKDVQIDNGYNNNPGSSSSKENVRDSRARRPVEIDSVAEVALDDVAVKAMISILSGYVKNFQKDQEFRTSMYHNCFAALNHSKVVDEIVAESKVISNLDQAIDTVEKAADNRASAKELKKASLKLSVITGLNANDLKDGVTSGYPNSVLSACGHLYLSVIYKIQKKDRISAKHLLQIFCDAPNAARMTIVPELWENVIYPHLSHLEIWYDQEVESLADDLHNERKLKQLKKVYNEILDKGTYEFALYYKDWLADGVEAPSIPSIHVPKVSVQEIENVSGGPSFSFSTQPMVSKKLYDSVFSQMRKPVSAEVDDYRNSERSDDDDDVYSFDGSVVEDKRTLTYPLEELEYQNDENAIVKQEGSESVNMLQSLPVAKVNELTLKRLAKFVFGAQQTERSVDLAETNRSSHDARYPDFSPIRTRPLVEDGGQLFNNIPEDYVCPLTGLLFEDPVTIETGQTYERAAIIDWFNKGNTTCPVTGKKLECHTVPFTNSIVKRLIDSWKSKHSREILASASQPVRSPGEHKYKSEAAVFIIEQLLTVFGKDENTANAKQLIDHGGLHFLVQQFGDGNLDKKSRVAALLSRCVNADSSCRRHVAIQIEKQGLMELLHCKEVNSRTNVVFLLFELICLNRRKDVQFFLSGLQKEGIVSSMHILLLFLQSCSPEQKPFVAVLLLHLDLMVDQQKYSIYREEAVDTITSALDSSLTDENVREACCKALLILGGRISFTGDVITDDYVLQKAGFNERESDDKITIDNEEEKAVDNWLIKLSASLIGDGKKSFLDSLSKCLSCRHKDMVKVGLITVVWLSSSLILLRDLGSKISALSILIANLKENLENSEWVEHKVLAATSLLNFSRIPDCMNLFTTIADEISESLKNLAETSSTAKELYYAVITLKDL